jgi:PAS domain S-box-containing protein
MRRTAIVMSVALLFGLGFWWIDSIYEYYMFSENLRFMLFQEPLKFLDSLVLNVPTHALINRISFLLACLIGGGLVSWALAKNRRSQVRYRTYVRNAPHGMAVIDASGQVREVNRAWSEILARRPEELVGRPLEASVTREDRGSLRQALEKLERPGPVEVELGFSGPDGQRIETALSGIGINSQERLLFLRDITEARKLEERLRQSQKLESIGQLAGGIAHDFNNLLTGVLGNAELLKLEEPSDEMRRKYADEILSASRRGADLTRKLLNFARREKFAVVPVDLHELTEEAISLLRHSIDRRIDIHHDFQASASWVQGDPSQLQNAILNLGLNARDALPEGGRIVFSTRNVHIDGQDPQTVGEDLRPGDYIEVNVSDNGVGMDEQTQERIFDPFFTTKDPGRGTGLGLSGVYGTVKAHQGAITVYSQPGKGTTMKLYLPTSSPQETGGAGGQPSVHPVRGTGRILVVDDEDVVRSSAVGTLKALGYLAIEAPDGARALELLGSEKFDLVLLDLIMPRMSGSEVLVRIRRENTQVPVVVSSGFSSSLAWEDLKKQGADGFLPKPYGIEELSEMLRRHLPESLENPEP